MLPCPMTILPSPYHFHAGDSVHGKGLHLHLALEEVMILAQLGMLRDSNLSRYGEGLSNHGGS